MLKTINAHLPALTSVGEGRHLACACSDGSVHVVNASLNAGKGKAFVGMCIQYSVTTAMIEYH